MSKDVFIAPHIDVVFKSIFCNENEKGPLMSLLSSIMELPLESFEELQLLNTELIPENVEQKSSRLDLRIRLKDKTEIDVEIQVINQVAYKERILYYWAKLYSGNLKKSETYDKLKKCVVINIVYFELFKMPRMHTKFQLFEAKENELLTDHLEIHFLELSKLNAYNRAIENEVLIDWAEFLSLKKEGDLMALKDRTDLPEHLLKAIEKYESIKDDPDLYYEALNLQMGIMDQIQRLDDATNKGREEGREEGREDAQKQIAKNLKNLGIDYKTIQEATGLDLETIEKL